VALHSDIKTKLARKFPKIKPKIISLFDIEDPAEQNDVEKHEAIITNLERNIISNFDKLINFAEDRNEKI